MGIGLTGDEEEGAMDMSFPGKNECARKEQWVLHSSGKSGYVVQDHEHTNSNHLEMPRLQPPLQLRRRDLLLQFVLLIIPRVYGPTGHLDMPGGAIDLLGVRGGGHLGDGFRTITHHDGSRMDGEV